MTDRQRMLRVHRRNLDLARENEQLRRELEHKQEECQELEDANTELRVELQAADYVVGEAMDAALEGQR